MCRTISTAASGASPSTAVPLRLSRPRQPRTPGATASSARPAARRHPPERWQRTGIAFADPARCHRVPGRARRADFCRPGRRDLCGMSFDRREGHVDGAGPDQRQMAVGRWQPVFDLANDYHWRSSSQESFRRDAAIGRGPTFAGGRGGALRIRAGPGPPTGTLVATDIAAEHVNRSATSRAGSRARPGFAARLATEWSGRAVTPVDGRSSTRRDRIPA